MGKNHRIVGIVLITLAMIGIFALASLTPLVIYRNSDFVNVFSPAGRVLLEGQNPYLRVNRPERSPWFLFNPPWNLIPLIPLSVLPLRLRWGAWMLIEITSILYACYKLGASKIGSVLILASCPMVFTLLSGQLEWQVILGLVLPHPVGLLLLTAKPQIGAFVGLLWVIEAYQEGKIGAVVRLIWPLSLVFVISLVLFGFWPRYMLTAPQVGFNLSPFPWLVPLGLFCFYRAVKNKDDLQAFGSSLCLVPYFTPNSLIALPIAFARKVKVQAVLFVAGWVGLWLLIWFTDSF
jgi:hypothetical protein